MSEGLVKIIIEITPGEKESRVKSFKKVMEFPVDYEDLPLRVSANSAKVVRKALTLAEEMCED